jgi:hypothetical protein
MASIIQAQGISLGNGLLSNEIGRGSQDFLDIQYEWNRWNFGIFISKSKKATNGNSSIKSDEQVI